MSIEFLVAVSAQIDILSGRTVRKKQTLNQKPRAFFLSERKTATMGEASLYRVAVCQTIIKTLSRVRSGAVSTVSRFSSTQHAATLRLLLSSEFEDCRKSASSSLRGGGRERF